MEMEESVPKRNPGQDWIDVRLWLIAVSAGGKSAPLIAAAAAVLLLAAAYRLVIG